MIRRTQDTKMIFQKAPLAELQSDYVSPGRGWYHIYTFQPDRKDEEQLRWLPLEENETLALVRLDIGAFRSREIDEETLAFTGRILDRFAEAGKDVILRILYDTEGKGLVREPDDFWRVCEHMQSLGEVVREHADEILLAQGLLIGSWGEMHDSRYLDPDEIRELGKIWKSATGGLVPLAVRKPAYARMLMPENVERLCRRENGAVWADIGLYDDAILSDETHMGTFGWKRRRDASWEESWCAADEYLFIDATLRHVPLGGEAVGTGEQTGEAILAQLRKLSVTYLNSIYHPDTLERWKRLEAPDGGLLYTYIGNHMGYRFVVKEVGCKRGRLHITVANDGFAPLYEEARMQLVAVNPQGHRQNLALDIDPRTIMPGAHKVVQVDLSKAFYEPFSSEKGTARVENEEKSDITGGYRLYLEIVRKRDGKPVRLANEGAAEQLEIGSLE